MNGSQAHTIIKEVEELLRNHAIWYTKSIEYKDNHTIIRLTDISIKVDKPKLDR